jgi:hypothetical protein
MVIALAGFFGLPVDGVHDHYSEEEGRPPVKGDPLMVLDVERFRVPPPVGVKERHLDALVGHVVLKLDPCTTDEAMRGISPIIFSITVWTKKK